MTTLARKMTSAICHDPEEKNMITPLMIVSDCSGPLRTLVVIGIKFAGM